MIIVNWNSKDYLRRCLESLRRHLNGLAHEVIVVDGASYDGCGEMLADEFPNVQFIQCPENIGFGRCNNLGVERASGDALLLLNPDTEIRAGFSSLVDCLARLPRAGILAPRLLNSNGSLQTSCVQSLPTPLNQFLDSDFLHRLLPRSPLWGTYHAFSAKDPVEVEAVSGACMLMWADTFRKVGGFSPEFFMYGEDLDLCATVHRRGLRIYHVPAVEVEHHGGASSSHHVSQFSTLHTRMAGETYMRRNHGPGTAVRYRFLQGASALLRMALATPVALLPGPRRTLARSAIRKWGYVLSWVFGGPKLPFS